VLVVGTGLIGTSVALALRRRGHQLWLTDTNAAQLQQALRLGAGEVYSGEAVDLTVVAVPPSSTAAVVVDRLCADAGSTITDTASVKGELQREIAVLLPATATGSPAPSALTRYVGGHPLAGRERGGPHRARADMFAGRAWVLTPGPESSPVAVDDTRWLVTECGAIPLTLSAAEHDHALAITSHLPQMVASGLAAQLASQPDDVLQLVGQALRDMTRIAAADPQLWADIAIGNAAQIADAIDGLTGSLHDVAVALRAGAKGADAVSALIQSGQKGFRRMPGKHGGSPRSYLIVPVIVPDQPGQMARLLADAAAAGVNVEDLRVEHAPGLPVGLIELFVGPEAAAPLRAALTERGWTLTDEETPS
jgi:prephenate dehydrogenase